MTKLFQDVIDRARQWPDDRQDEAARLLLDFEEQRTASTRLSPEQVAEVERIQKEIRAGTAAFATDDQMAAFWKKCGL
ncbi:hypothetical protein [Pseudolabrys sp. FHR47]|uniref:hypothetical protein n=1 Tax=Pseudolabrys sp. FHR47 TaxID=2562284 RepID=UPI0010BEE215|nr:hypothetical protein [Pseudolabrys sp. FHR47]